MVDKNLVLKKIKELQQRQVEIEEFKSITIDQYKKDWKIQRIVERTLQIMIEICIDISNHIISDNKYRIPQNNAESFEILFENNIINKKLKDTMKKMVGFRNIIVHEYFEIDPEIVVNILKSKLDDFKKFEKAVIKFLKG